MGMMAHVRLRVLLIVALLASMVVAQPDREPDTYDRAVEAMALRRYRYAIYEIEQFLQAYIGDAREPAARKLIVEAHNKLIERYTDLGWPDEAAYRQLRLAQLGSSYGLDPEALRAKALVTMTDAIKSAIDGNRHAGIVELTERWPRLFGDDHAPPTSPDQLHAARLGATILTLSEPGMIEFLPEVLDRYHPATPPLDELNAQVSRDLTMDYLRTLAERGWFGRFSAEMARLQARDAVEADRRLANLYDRLVIAAAEAHLNQGNRPMIARFLRDHANDPLLPLNQRTMQRHQNASQSIIADPGAARELSFDRGVRGPGVWRDDGQGFHIPRSVRLDHADITVTEGAVIEGGTIEMYQSTLRLRGSRKRPIILRNVRIDIDTGSLEAENTIFIDCTFRRPGDRYEGRHVSQWRLNQCMVYRSNFERLDAGRYGVQLTNSIFVECDLPARRVWGSDLARQFNDNWSEVSGCMFYECDIELPFLWTTTGGSFLACTFADYGGFRSTSNLQVRFFTTEPNRTVTRLLRETVLVGSGEVTYTAMPRPGKLSTPDEFWLLLPVDLRADQRPWPHIERAAAAP